MKEAPIAGLRTGCSRNSHTNLRREQGCGQGKKAGVAARYTKSITTDVAFSSCQDDLSGRKHRHEKTARALLFTCRALPLLAREHCSPGAPHLCCRSVLMRFQFSPCGRNLLLSSRLIILPPARPRLSHRSLQRHRRAKLARQQQLAQPERYVNLVRRDHQ